MRPTAKGMRSIVGTAARNVFVCAGKSAARRASSLKRSTYPRIRGAHPTAESRRSAPGAPPDPQTTPVASGVTAAWLHGLGEVGPGPLEFCCATRRQTQRAGLRLRKRAIDPAEVTLAGGIPTTSAALTILDLVDNGEDLSLVAGVLRDALATGAIPDKQDLAKKLGRRTAAAGLPKGASLYRYLTEGRR